MSKNGLTKEDTAQEHPLQAIVLCDPWGEESRWGPLVRPQQDDESDDTTTPHELRPWVRPASLSQRVRAKTDGDSTVFTSDVKRPAPRLDTRITRHSRRARSPHLRRERHRTRQDLDQLFHLLLQILNPVHHYSSYDRFDPWRCTARSRFARDISAGGFPRRAGGIRGEYSAG